MLRFSDLAITSYDLARYITEVDLLLARLIAGLRSSIIHSNRAGAPIHVHVRSNIYNGKSTCK